jgi:hypothetical protein
MYVSHHFGADPSVGCLGLGIALKAIMPRAAASSDVKVCTGYMEGDGADGIQLINDLVLSWVSGSRGIGAGSNRH